MTTTYLTENFDADTAAAIAPGWTAVSGTWLVGTTSPVSGAQSFSNTTNNTAGIVAYTSGSSATTDQEMAVSWVQAAATSIVCPMVRYTATQNGYFMYVTGANIVLYKMVAGTPTSIATIPFIPTTGVTYSASIRAVGTSIEGRIWPASGTRPKAPVISATDATFTAGTCALYNGKQTNVGAADNVLWDDGTQASGSALIAVTDSNIFYSPCNWDMLGVGDLSVSVASAQTTCSGAYTKFSVTGTTTLMVMLDTTNNSGFPAVNMPILGYSIDGGPKVEVQIPNAAAMVLLTTGLSVGSTHSVRLYCKGIVQNASGERWGSAGVSPTNNLRIQGIKVDTGATTSAYPLLRPKRAVFFGDSICEGLRSAGTTTEPADHATSHPWWTGPAMNCEYGVVGYGGQGWTGGGYGNIPAFNVAWNLIQSGRARTFGTLDYVFVNQGFNGTFAATDVSGWLTSARAAFGASPWIFIVANPGGKNSSINAAGVAAYIAANPTDTKVAYIDLADVIETRWFAGPVNNATPTEFSIDSVHPLEVGHAMIGSVIARKAQALAGGAATATTTRTVSLTLVDGSNAPRASLTGLTWALFDKTKASTLNSIVDSGSGATTNSSGVLTLSVKTTLAAGANAWLVISNSDGTLTQSPAAMAFAGPVVLS